jgi:hypothetical protein
MPFKSKAQRRKFAQLLVEGKITDEAYERWNKETGGAELPERIGSKKESGSESKRGARPKAKPSSRSKKPKPKPKPKKSKSRSPAAKRSSS